MREDILDLCDAAIELGLLVFGLVVFAVFGQITERTRFLDLLGDLFFAGRLEIEQLLLELLEPQCADFEFLCHFYINLHGKNPLFSRLQA